MRPLAIFAALLLVTAPLLAAPGVAHADGVERQRAYPRASSTAPPSVIIEEGPETVTLPDSFFEGDAGVGADIGIEPLYNPAIVRDRSAHDWPFDFAPERPRVNGGFFVGRRDRHGGGAR